MNMTKNMTLHNDLYILLSLFASYPSSAPNFLLPRSNLSRLPICRFLSRTFLKWGKMWDFIQDFSRGGGGGGAIMRKHALTKGVWGHAPLEKFDIYNL